MNKFFEIRSSGANSEAVLKSPNYTSKYLLGHFQKIKKLEEDLQRLPSKEEFFFLQTEGAFNAFTFIPLIVKDFSIERLYASTYSISRRTIEALVELHDCGRVERITLLINESMPKRNPVTIDLLDALVRERPNIEVQYAWTHAKVCLVKTMEGYYCIEGSGNWSENAHMEQYVFANSRGLFEFRSEIFERV